MRKASCLFAFLILALSLLNVPRGSAQRPASMPTCEGGYNIVRVSTVNPGMMDKFSAAVAAQKAWYKKVGAPDEIVMLRVMDTNTAAFSTTQALTMHKGATGTANAPHDADYDAFVALFKASSAITSQYVACEAK